MAKNTIVVTFDDVRALTDEQLEKELDTMYAFVDMFGYSRGFLSSEGMRYFNWLKGEDAVRGQRNDSY